MEIVSMWELLFYLVSVAVAGTSIAYGIAKERAGWFIVGMCTWLLLGSVGTYGDYYYKQYIVYPQYSINAYNHHCKLREYYRQKFSCENEKNE